jgi:hypothetical protein
VYSIYGIDSEGVVLYNGRDLDEMTITDDINQAPIFLHDTVKWDGCANLHFDAQDKVMLHFCGPKDVRDMNEMLQRVYQSAKKMMPSTDF